MRDRIVAALWAAFALAAIAISLAAAARVVSWLVGTGSAGIWKAALTLVLGAGAGAAGFAVLRNGADRGDH